LDIEKEKEEEKEKERRRRRWRRRRQQTKDAEKCIAFRRRKNVEGGGGRKEGEN
jgi:hypothetical protein